MMSLADYESWSETMHLLCSPQNAKRLMDSIASLEKGEGTERDWESLL